MSPAVSQSSAPPFLLAECAFAKTPGPVRKRPLCWRTPPPCRQSPHRRPPRWSPLPAPGVSAGGGRGRHGRRPVRTVAAGRLGAGRPWEASPPGGPAGGKAACDWRRLPCCWLWVCMAALPGTTPAGISSPPTTWESCPRRLGAGLAREVRVVRGPRRGPPADAGPLTFVRPSDLVPAWTFEALAVRDGTAWRPPSGGARLSAPGPAPPTEAGDPAAGVCPPDRAQPAHNPGEFDLSRTLGRGDTCVRPPPPPCANSPESITLVTPGSASAPGDGSTRSSEPPRRDALRRLPQPHTFRHGRGGAARRPRAVDAHPPRPSSRPAPSTCWSSPAWTRESSPGPCARGRAAAHPAAQGLAGRGGICPSSTCSWLTPSRGWCGPRRRRW